MQFMLLLWVLHRPADCPVCVNSSVTPSTSLLPLLRSQVNMCWPSAISRPDVGQCPWLEVYKYLLLGQRASSASLSPTIYSVQSGSKPGLCRVARRWFVFPTRILRKSPLPPLKKLYNQNENNLSKIETIGKPIIWIVHFLIDTFCNCLTFLARAMYAIKVITYWCVAVLHSHQGDAIHGGGVWESHIHVYVFIAVEGEDFKMWHWVGHLLPESEHPFLWMEKCLSCSPQAPPT